MGAQMAIFANKFSNGDRGSESEAQDVQQQEVDAGW